MYIFNLQRCRDQIRKKRQELFNSHRPGLTDANGSIHETLTEIVRKEFSDLSTSMVIDQADNSSQEYTWPMSQEELMGMEEEIIREEGIVLNYLVIKIPNKTEANTNRVKYIIIYNSIINNV